MAKWWTSGEKSNNPFWKSANAEEWTRQQLDAGRVCVFTSRKTDGLARIKNDAGAYRSENSARAFTFVDEETHSELHQEMQMRPASWRLKAQSQV